LNSVLCEICGNDNLPQACFCYYCGSRWGAAETTPPPATVPVYPANKSQDTVIVSAGFGLRFLAGLIDLIIIFITVFIFFRFSDSATRYLLTIVFAAILYFWLFTGLKGQTVGKMAAGIRVIRADGKPPGLGWAFVRETFGKFVSTLGFFFGFIWICFHENNRGWHDEIAGTYVVRHLPGKG
jgi:uncharacterized RDD family membrane protein YckC